MSGGPQVRIGIVGLGAAGRGFLPAIAKHPGLTLAAFAEADEQLRGRAAAELDVPAYAGIEQLLAHAGLDAVYIATPTQLHPEHVALACAAGKHVLVEKPMAVELAQAEAMIAAAERAGVQLLVGHSHSYDLPIQRMRELIAGGTLGRVRMVNTWCFTDWIYRPRRPEELDTGMGGGVTYRQGSHQFDILRLLCGGMVTRVHARTFDNDPARSAIGAHLALLDFADGAAATAVYNGYGNFSSIDLCFDIGEWGLPQPNSRLARAEGLTPEQELTAKQERAKRAIPGQAPFQPFFGLTVVSCEGGDIRQSPHGLLVYTRDGRSEIHLPSDRSPRDLVMAEFYDAVTGAAPALHTGRWGLANLEICAAAIASAAGTDLPLRHQVALPA
ncbi:MAG TPA: Gfo/Idh/MocA family oxidoreductase [Telluria sp.]|nr:Gfo/Idh/MocA family oxidoreductase [Telluria sp.]